MTSESKTPASQAQLSAALQPFVEEVVARFALAGLAVGIVKDGALVYAQGFGVRSLDTREPVTPRSLFHLASISKPFVATAIVQLAERGAIELAAPVVAYLPYFRLQDPRSSAITIQQLLSHTSGMPDPQDYQWHQPEDDAGALERYVRSLADVALLDAPGAAYAYSNAAFEVLGDIIAKVSGRSFEDYIKAHIFAPLAMPTSTFLRHEVAPDLATTPHLGAPLHVLPGAYPYNRAHAPSSTLHSSVAEMGHWLIANLNRGAFQGRRILQAESYTRLWHPYVATGEEIWEEAVGLGWMLGTYRGHAVIHHGGSDPGFSGEIVLVPAENSGVVVLANANTAAVGHVTDAALDLLLGFAPALPAPPITVPIGAALQAHGPAAAAASYQRLISQPAAYDARPGRFLDAIWGAIELHRPATVMPLLKLWLTLQPDAAQAYELLGQAGMITGARDDAALNLRRALELDPDNIHARDLLQRLESMPARPEDAA
jgi:CubicO group peptidase (beta-lactamase class C family)